MAVKLKIRRGLKADLPLLAEGELGYCTDTNELFIGTETGNQLVNGGGDLTEIIGIQKTAYDFGDMVSAVIPQGPILDDALYMNLYDNLIRVSTPDDSGRYNITGFNPTIVELYGVENENSYYDIIGTNEGGSILMTPANGGALTEFYFEEYQGEYDISYPEYNKSIIAELGYATIIIEPPLTVSDNHASLTTNLEGDIDLHFSYREIIGESLYPLQDQINAIPVTIPTTIAVPALAFPVKEIRYISGGYDIYDPLNYEAGVLYIIVDIGTPQSPGTIEGMFLGDGIEPPVA